MRRNDHEYKVMGLAPYSPKDGTERLAKIFRELIWVEGLKIRSRVPMLAYSGHLNQVLSEKRFDHIAGGIQKVTEELLIDLIKNTTKETGISDLIVGGGVFMNIKANMEIIKKTQVKSLFVMPSCGDESTAIGAAYWGALKNSNVKIKPLENLYLGPKFTPREIKEAVIKYQKRKTKIKITRLKYPAKQIAHILSKGDVVARFAGRMEFGARALGNRSILANPRKNEVIREINEQIKSRDFWMPFAPVIIEENQEEYLKNPKKIRSPHMMMGFKTTKVARKELIAGLHPFDFTARPQILSRSSNPDYYDIIYEFKKITGIGGLLNTSFNLHGEPIVCTPEDALRTFELSGLKYLVLEDTMIQKI